MRKIARVVLAALLTGTSLYLPNKLPQDANAFFFRHSRPFRNRAKIFKKKLAVNKLVDLSNLQNNSSMTKNVDDDAEVTNTSQTRPQNYLAVPTIQQNYNQCGPTALAMVLNFYGEGIDPSRNFMTMPDGTRATELNNRANEYEGFSSELIYRGTLEDLARNIDQGMPVIVGGQWDGADNGHYLVVTGYSRGTDGEIQTLYYNDPATGERTQYNADDFVTQFWSKRSSLYIVVRPDDPSRIPDNGNRSYADMRTGLVLQDGIDMLRQGFRGLNPFDSGGRFIGTWQYVQNLFMAPARMAVGLVKTISGAVGGFFDRLGNRIGGRTGRVVSGLGRGIARAGEVVGNAITRGINAIGRGIKRLWKRWF